jgi:hypothetical protein
MGMGQNCPKIPPITLYQGGVEKDHGELGYDG